MRTITLYTRVGCHLCADAEALLRRLGHPPILVDVDSDPGLQTRYGDQVPVLEVDRQRVLSGIIREPDLRRVLGSVAR